MLGHALPYVKNILCVVESHTVPGSGDGIAEMHLVSAIFKPIASIHQPWRSNQQNQQFMLLGNLWCFKLHTSRPSLLRGPIALHASIPLWNLPNPAYAYEVHP